MTVRKTFKVTWTSVVHHEGQLKARSREHAWSIVLNGPRTKAERTAYEAMEEHAADDVEVLRDWEVKLL